DEDRLFDAEGGDCGAAPVDGYSGKRKADSLVDLITQGSDEEMVGEAAPSALPGWLKALILPMNRVCASVGTMQQQLADRDLKFEIAQRQYDSIHTDLQSSVDKALDTVSDAKIRANFDELDRKFQMASTAASSVGGSSVAGGSGRPPNREADGCPRTTQIAGDKTKVWIGGFKRPMLARVLQRHSDWVKQQFPLGTTKNATVHASIFSQSYNFKFPDEDEAKKFLDVARTRGLFYEDTKLGQVELRVRLDAPPFVRARHKVLGQVWQRVVEHRKSHNVDFRGQHWQIGCNGFRGFLFVTVNDDIFVARIQELDHDQWVLEPESSHLSQFQIPEDSQLDMSEGMLWEHSMRAARLWGAAYLPRDLGGRFKSWAEAPSHFANSISRQQYFQLFFGFLFRLLFWQFQVVILLQLLAFAYAGWPESGGSAAAAFSAS
ncbi:unnamed protein product, partial [Prorocentrum cordatum]